MPAFSATISKGQVEIPAEVLSGIGLHDGDTIEFILEQGQARVRIKDASENVFDKCAGSMPSDFHSMDDVVAWQREMRDQDNEQP